MMLNPDHRPGHNYLYSYVVEEVVQKSHSLLHSTYYYRAQYALYMHLGIFPIYMDILHIIHNWDIDSARLRPRQRRPPRPHTLRPAGRHTGCGASNDLRRLPDSCSLTETAHTKDHLVTRRPPFFCASVVFVSQLATLC